MELQELQLFETAVPDKIKRPNVREATRKNLLICGDGANIDQINFN
jgi:hypothetical protein